MKSFFFLFLSVLMCSLSASAINMSHAAADSKHPTSGHLTGGLHVGTGVLSDNANPSQNPYRLGFGVDTGFTFGFPLYLGGSFTYFRGTENFGVRVNAIQLLGNVGVDISLGKYVVLRPMVGFGVDRWSESITVGSATTIRNADAVFAIAPGAQFLIVPSDKFYLGGTFRYTITNPDNPSHVVAGFFNLGIIL